MNMPYVLSEHGLQFCMTKKCLLLWFFFVGVVVAVVVAVVAVVATVVAVVFFIAVFSLNVFQSV